MKFDLTIGWAWIEFFCHFFAALLYTSSGFSVARGGGAGFFALVAAVALTVIGSNL